MWLAGRAVTVTGIRIVTSRFVWTLSLPCVVLAPDAARGALACLLATGYARAVNGWRRLGVTTGGSARQAKRAAIPRTREASTLNDY